MVEITEGRAFNLSDFKVGHYAVDFTIDAVENMGGEVRETTVFNSCRYGNLFLDKDTKRYYNLAEVNDRLLKWEQYRTEHYSYKLIHFVLTTTFSPKI